MNEDVDKSAEPETASSNEIETTPPAVRECAAFFDRSDWVSFGITTLLVLAVYLFTLAPAVTLEMSGELSTAAMYAGVPHPPGFPLWAIYAWFFTKLVPFSNVAWRVAVSSAVAGALTCGLIALMVSTGGARILEGISDFRRLEAKEERWLRFVSGVVAGMAFGFAGPFWGLAVIADTRPLSIFVFSIVLCLLLRWLYAPERARYLYAAFFVYGLTVSASQMLVPSVLGLPFFVMFGDQRIGRDLSFAAGVLAVAMLVAKGLDVMPILEQYPGRAIYVWIAILAFAICAGLIVRTRSFLTRWRPALCAGFLSLVGMLPHLYLPLSSMTNPPMNWGYPRTVEGFLHVLNRGQFEHFNVTGSVGRLMKQMEGYVETAAGNVGIIYLLVALVPFYFFRRMRTRERGLILGLLAFFLSLSLFMIFILNPPPDRQARQLLALFLSPSYVVLTIWAGYGLILLGTFFSRPRLAPGPFHEPD